MPDIHFECPKCNQTLDAPEELAAQLIECPTCKETIEVPARNQRTETPKPPKPTPAPLPPIATTKPLSPQQSRIVDSSKSSNGATSFFSIVFILASIGLVVVGLFLVGSGLSGEADESRKYEGSAIRQTVYAVQYGSGFIVIALGLILAALSGILMKRKD